MNTIQKRSPKGFVDFKQIKDQVTLVQVLERYELLESFQQSGDRLSGVCPIHKGTNVTQFRVSISRNCFNCFGSCGRGGNVIDFVSLMEEIPFREAAVLLQSWFLPEAPVSENRRPSGKSERQAAVLLPGAETDSPEEEGLYINENVPLSFELKTLQGDHPYLAGRGISAEAITQFGLGYCPRGCLRGYIAIPVHNAGGQIVAYAGRWPGELSGSQPKYKFPKGYRKSLELFNLHRALQEPEDLPLVIVEGFFDCISLWEAGVTKCVALMGSHLSEQQAEILLHCLPRDAEIELLFDADEAGRKGMDRAASLLEKHGRVRQIHLPEEGMQPDHLSADEVVMVFE
jgi:DNA primase